MHHLAIADPLKHELVREDALIVDLEPVLVELELDGSA